MLWIINVISSIGFFSSRILVWSLLWFLSFLWRTHSVHLSFAESHWTLFLRFLIVCCFFNTAIVNGLWARLSSDVYCLLVCFPRDPKLVMGTTTSLLFPLTAKFISFVFFFFFWSHNFSNSLRSSFVFQKLMPQLQFMISLTHMLWTTFLKERRVPPALPVTLRNIYKVTTTQWSEVWVQQLGLWRCLWVGKELLPWDNPRGLFADFLLTS